VIAFHHHRDIGNNHIVIVIQYIINHPYHLLLLPIFGSTDLGVTGSSPVGRTTRYVTKLATPMTDLGIPKSVLSGTPKKPSSVQQNCSSIDTPARRQTYQSNAS
jgi:hypothetical protein